jgi:ankyrin repeat protein
MIMDDCLVGDTPIAQAAFAGKVSILRLLLDHGGDPAMPNAMGRTPLHNAAQNGVFPPSIYERLRSRTICMPALNLHVPPGHNEAVILLLSRGVDVDPIINGRGGTPLHLAAGKGKDQAVKVLLEHGADVSCYLLCDLVSLLGNS